VTYNIAICAGDRGRNAKTNDFWGGLPKKKGVEGTPA